MKINIPNPCHEDYSKMSPQGDGRYCNMCEKTVVDFTNMSKEEILNYFLSMHSKKICGHFKNDQLEDKKEHNSWVVSLFLNSKNKVEASKSPLIVKSFLLFFIGVSLMLCGCKDNKNNESGGKGGVEHRTTGELAVPDDHFKDSLDDSNCNFKDDENI